jgi:hypothetical protein
MKGAIEDPTLDRALSATGLTTSEELQAQALDVMNVNLHMFMRANFEEPKGGWPEPPIMPRPNDQPKVEKEKPKMASAAEIVQFTEEDRETRI